MFLNCRYIPVCKTVIEHVELYHTLTRDVRSISSNGAMLRSFDHVYFLLFLKVKGHYLEQEMRHQIANVI